MEKAFAKIVVVVLALPRLAKRLLALLVDLNLCILSVWIAYYLRLGEFVSFLGSNEWAHGVVLAATVSVGIALPIFVVSGMYRAIFRYSGWPAFKAVARAVVIYGLLYVSVFTVIGVAGVPRTVGIIQPILLLILVGASRALAKIWLGEEYLRFTKYASRSKVLIYGAGAAGRQLAAAMVNSHQMQVIGFLDDAEHLHEQVLNGLPVYNPIDLGDLVATLNISDVLLAMPSLSRSRRNEILHEVRSAPVAVRTLPSVNDLALGKVGIFDLRELDIDDLLGREPVSANYVLLAKNIVGKVVLVTGAGGSIGGELCRQIMALNPAKLLLIEQSEFALYAIHQELEERLSRIENDMPPVLVPLMASVLDDERMRQILSTWHPDTVYHSAAYKHVPLVEHNPTSGIKNNVFGTLRTAQAAAENGVTDFVLVSTDKAVRPTNVMGASKRLAEMALQALAANRAGTIGSRGTKFSMVRFGNVLGSSGSVVPKFRQQIREGGPITLTHPNVTRYFMTIPEAAQLVIQAGAMAKGGDVFVLDMGQPLKIMDLARRMIELSGLTVQDEDHPDGDIEIRLTGLRSGEKLYEELLIGDNPEPTEHPRIIKAHEEFIPWAELESNLKALEMSLSVNDADAIRLMMQQMVAGYTPKNDIVDWLYLEQEARNQ